MVVARLKVTHPLDQGVASACPADLVTPVPFTVTPLQEPPPSVMLVAETTVRVPDAPVQVKLVKLVVKVPVPWTFTNGIPG